MVRKVNVRYHPRRTKQGKTMVTQHTRKLSSPNKVRYKGGSRLPEDTPTEIIQQSNYERYIEKGYIVDILFFKDFMLADDEEKKRLIKSVDLKQLLQKRKEIQTEKRKGIPLISSSSNKWFPYWVQEVNGYIGGSDFYRKYTSDLGTDLLRLGLDKEFKTLSEFDEKARTKKIRTKLPKELIGKDLEFQKVSDEYFTVKIKDTKSQTSLYHKKLIELEEAGFVKIGKDKELEREINEFNDKLKEIDGR